jgi:uncharacterized protein (DUF1800 family)
MKSLPPLPDSRWNEETAAHLLNRAGFGGSPGEIEALAALGFEKAVAFLVEGEDEPAALPLPAFSQPNLGILTRLREARQMGEEERQKVQQMVRREEGQKILELRHWWLERMRTASHPLREKMTLFWHGHFATSIEKVKNVYFLWRQNEVFRQNALGAWPILLTQASKDPAMLVWLDGAQNRKASPNENFAREVMELFALGEGHYTEKDIQEAARAFTGWSVLPDTQEFVFRPRQHDSGSKTLFGKTARFTGEEVLDLLAHQPQSALFLTAKLWKFFAGNDPTPEQNEGLAAIFRESKLEFRPLLQALFSSEDFYAPAVVRNQVKSPVQWLVSSCRYLERPLPPAAVSANMLRMLGQNLFAPPNVKGWDGGISWITTGTLLARDNFATLLIHGQKAPRAPRPPLRRRENAAQAQVDPLEVALLAAPELRSDPQKLLGVLEKRLFQTKLKPRHIQALHDYIHSQVSVTDDVVRQTLRLMMSIPDYQLT